MREYRKQATDFLASCNATMNIQFVGTEINPHWNETEERNKYRFTITTPQGKMEGDFWDSIYNKMNGTKPNEYDILACLEKYEVGSIDDFMHEFGYEVNSTRDFTNLLNTYNAVVKEYNDLRRIFTDEQMEMLREIQ